MNDADLRRIAAQLRRAADLIDGRASFCDHEKRCATNAAHALLVSHAWSIPLSAASGPGPKNQPSDPTQTAALGRARPEALVHARLNRELREAYIACVALARRLVIVTVPAKPSNERTGIGHCESCGRYCNGESSNRLKSSRCPACYERARRRAARA